MSEENLYTPNCIRTFTGIYVNVFEPTEEMICIEDIAHSLSNQCRFGGHLPQFYSVAQHCILCAEMVDEPFKLEALLHDASEAYLMDVPSPVKQGLTNYKDIEYKIMELISKKFNTRYPLSLTVKNIDKRMLEIEWTELMLGHKSIENFACWTPGYAKKKFIEAFYSFKLTTP